MLTQPEPELPPGPLPIKHNLTIAYATSILIAILMAAVSVISLMDPNRFYPNDALLQSFVPTDWVNLMIGVPFLLVTMILAWRGKLIGLLCWPGALFYSLYVYVPYLIAVPFNVLFPLYLVLIPLNVFTMIGIVASVDADAVRRRLDGRVPVRVAGGVLVGLTVLIILRQSVLMFSALANPTAVQTTDLALWIADLAVSCPAMLIGGLLLWRRKSLGYVAGAPLLLAYGVLSLGLLPYLLFQAQYTGKQLDVASLAVLLGMAAICLAPFTYFARGAAESKEL